MPILKSLILLLFLSVSVSAFSGTYLIISNPYQSEFEKTNLEPVSSDLFRLLKGDSYVYYKIRDSFSDVYYFNTDTGMTGGIYQHTSGYYYYLESSPSFKSVCGKPLSYASITARDCDPRNSPDGSWWISISARKANKYSFTEVGTCKTDEEFNTATGQCQKCASNESWDPDTQKCYRDCSKDGGINKIGNTDGSCIDCSSFNTVMGALNCICMGSGHGSGQEYYQKNQVDPSASPYALKGKCTDGEIVDFVDPAINDKSEKPDDNKTKPDTPKPDDNKTKPDDPKPSDPTTPGTGDKGKDGKKDGKGNKDDAKGDNNTTIINNNNGKNNGNDPKFNPGDFNYDNLKKDEEGLTGKYMGAIGDTLKNFDGFKNGVDQFIDNVKGRGLSDVSKQSVPRTCSHKEIIDFFGHTITMDFDFCKIISPASGAFYYLFYVFFFGCFLFLIIKLLIFSF